MATENKRMRQRGDVAADFTSDNPILLQDEIAVQRGATAAETALKIGNGSSVWTALPFFSNAGSICVMAWNTGTSQYFVAGGNPTTAPRRWWVGPIPPVDSSGPFNTFWVELDFFTNTALV